MRFRAHGDSGDVFFLENKLGTENWKPCRICKILFSESSECLFVQDVMVFLLQRIKSKALFLLPEDQNLRYANVTRNQ